MLAMLVVVAAIALLILQETKTLFGI